MEKFFLILILSASIGCMQLKAIENQFATPLKVKCLSGGRTIYEGKPDGIYKGDGGLVLIRDPKTGLYIELEGDCLYYYK